MYQLEPDMATDYIYPGKRSIARDETSLLVPPAPSAVTAPATNHTVSYTVTWPSEATPSFTLQEQVNGGAWDSIYTGAATSKAVSGKGNGTYGYRVQACNSGGCSGWSSTKSTTVLLSPATPATPNAQQTGSSKKPTVSVTWSSVATATSYQLE